MRPDLENELAKLKVDLAARRIDAHAFSLTVNLLCPEWEMPADCRREIASELEIDVSDPRIEYIETLCRTYVLEVGEQPSRGEERHRRKRQSSVMFMGRHASNLSGRCTRTHREIATTLAMSVDTVQRSIAKLIKCG